MQVVFDASTLLLAFDPNAKPPIDPINQRTIDQAGARVRNLLSVLDRERARVILPTPVVSEVLMRLTPTATKAVLGVLSLHPTIDIAPFDLRCAVELVHVTNRIASRSDKRAGIDAPWSKVKFDRQIISIARIWGANQIYSDDRAILALAQKLDITVTRTSELPLPS